ncbi:MAG: hypothetical protein JSU96_12015 [Acidobacteriota bacterium]|nr:MAG: hypothetical protein JSU96_12015 [Acidobacteriota bacterium]
MRSLKKLIQKARRASRSLQVLRRTVLILGFAGLFLLPVEAATLTGIREGTHPDFTRVVFESDEFVRFEEPSVPESGVYEIRFTSVSSPLPERLSFSEAIERINLNREGNLLTARVILSFQNFRPKLFTLSGPDRVVVDFFLEDAPRQPVADFRETTLDLAGPKTEDRPRVEDLSAQTVLINAKGQPGLASESSRSTRLAGISAEAPLQLVGLLGLSLVMVAMAFVWIKKVRREGLVRSKPGPDRRRSQKIADLDLRIQRELVEYHRLTGLKKL